MKKKLISTVLITFILSNQVAAIPLSFAASPQEKEETQVAAATTSWEYNYTGSTQSFTSPSRAVYQVELYGAQGANTTGATGGKGSYVKGTIEIAKNQSLNIYVGGTNGYNGGGSGASMQASGGGATDIRLGGTGTNNRIAVAAGGGGSTGGIIYHSHTGSATTGGGCYSSPIYHSHISSCYVSAYCGAYGDGPHDTWNNDGDPHGHNGWYTEHHPDCGQPSRQHAFSVSWREGEQAPTRVDRGHTYNKLTCTKAGTVEGFSLGCGKTEGVTVDEEYYNPGKIEEQSNGISFQGSTGGGGGYEGGQTGYAGTNYTNNQFSSVTKSTGAREGNGYAKITLVASYPEVSLKANTTNLTAGNVTLTATASDYIGLASAPYSWNDAARVTANTFTATKNGTYKVNVVSSTNKTVETSVKVTNIDKVKPVVNNVPQTISGDKKTMSLTVEATDSATSEYAASGIAGYALTTTNTAPSSFQTGNTFNVTKNGTYYLWAKDNVGNVSLASQQLVKDIEMDIDGTITWNDSTNQYGSRIARTLKLYRKVGEGAAEFVTQTEIAGGQTSYHFQVREVNDSGAKYTYWIEQDNMPGYETIINGYNMVHNLIVPTYTSSVSYETIDTFQDRFLKNGKVSVTAQVQASNANREKAGTHSGVATLTVDSAIGIDTSSITAVYEDGTTHAKTNLTNFTVNGNTISVPFGTGTNFETKAGDKITITVNGKMNEIKTYHSEIKMTVKLRDYRGSNTTINLGEVTKTGKDQLVEYQMPQAKFQVTKHDSVTEGILSDAEFTLYEWNGSTYVQKQVLTDPNGDGIYESNYYEWNKTSGGKYKVVETKVPANHKDGGFSMEYSLNQLKTANYTVTPDYDNSQYKIAYVTNPDDFDRTN